MSQAVMSLEDLGFVAGLPPAETGELLAVSELRSYRDAETVFTQGEAMPGMLVVVQGLLNVFQADGRGKFQLVDVLRPGDSAGMEEAFDKGAAASGGQARGHTKCWVVPPAQLRLLAARNPAVATWAGQHLAARVRHLISLVETLSMHTVPERVAQLILAYRERDPNRRLVEFRETQEDSAQRIGASREAFSRALRLLADLGLIKNMFPVVRILDVQKLHRFGGGMAQPEPIQALGRPPLASLRPLAPQSPYLLRRHALAGV